MKTGHLIKKIKEETEQPVEREEEVEKGDSVRKEVLIETAATADKENMEKEITAEIGTEHVG